MSVRSRTLPILVGGLLACIGLIVAHLLIGRSDLPAGAVVRSLIGRGDGGAVDVIVLEYRLPRVLVGLGAGALLGIAGVLAQVLMGNPLAEPATTGVGAGAALGVVTALVLMPGRADLAGPAAFAGALAVGVVLVILVGTGPSLIVVGVLVGALAAAVTALMLVVDSQPTGVLLRWLVGSLNARTTSDWAALWPWLVGLTLAALLVAPWLDLLALGPAMATSLGTPTWARAVVAVLAVLATAAAVAAVGAVAFVGLAAPHLSRSWVGSGHMRVLPVAAVLGAVLLAGADLVAFSVSVGVPGGADASGVPVGAVTALLGAPLLVVMSRREVR